jgi:acetyl esterase/lipase
MHDNLDPELEPPLREFYSFTGGKAIEMHDIAKARKAWERVATEARRDLPPVEGVIVEDRWVPGPMGAPEVRLRIYRPKSAAGTMPTVFWIRGGGLIMGWLEQDDRPSRLLSIAANCMVVAVEYRWAPEHPFPAPVEDCYAGLKWLSIHGSALGIDISRIVIAGESGGGAVCGALAYFVRDRAEFGIVLQMLICPQLDDRDALPDPTCDQWFVTYPPRSCWVGWRAYLQQDPGLSNVPMYSVPARASDLRGLAPACVFVGDLDIFCKGSVAYAGRLMEANVPVELHVYPRAYHGFQLFAPESSVSKQFFSDRLHALLQAFNR